MDLVGDRNRDQYQPNSIFTRGAESSLLKTNYRARLGNPFFAKSIVKSVDEFDTRLVEKWRRKYFTKFLPTPD